MTRAQADRLAEGDRVKTKELVGTVVGATKNCVSIQWDGRTTPEIFTNRRHAEYQQRGTTGR
jgi:preprotein translocase subunit YajC